MKTRLFIIAACVTLIVCMMALPASAAENEYTLSGRWEWNDTLSPYPGNSNTGNMHKFNVAFTSGGTSYTYLGLGDSDEPQLGYGTASYNVGRPTPWTLSDGWSDMSYKIIDFGDGVSVGAELYTYMTNNAVWLDAPPPPSPIQLLMTDVGALVAAVLGFVATVATTVVGNPILLLFAVLSLVGIGVGLFVRMKNVSR